MSPLARSGVAALSARPLDDRRLALIAALLAVVIAGCGATVGLDAPSAALNVFFTLAMPVLPALAWWAYLRAPTDLRRFCGFMAAAASLWLVGSLVWYYNFAAAGYRDPPTPGPWDGVFVVAYSLAVAGVFYGLRDALPLRHAVLDASVAAVAGLALGAAIIGHELADGFSVGSLATLLRPLFGVVVLTLIASAAFGAWQGLPLSVVLFAAGQAVFTVGSFVYGYAVEPGHVAGWWAELTWLIGTMGALLAATVIVLRVDRPVRVGVRPAIPHHPAGAGASLLAALGALAVTVAVVAYGHGAGNRAVLIVGLSATAWIGAAMAFRARTAIREVEIAYAELDRAHLALEHKNDRVAEANEELARANAEIRSVHGAFEDLLVIADERTGGAMRELIEEAGEDVAEMFGRYRAADDDEERDAGG